jgi:mRNA-degrading endonuclease RelE of RelBE toxin-antitoxin system
LEIKEAIVSILKNPTIYSIRYKNIRIAHPKIFPYNIHLYIDTNSSTVVVTAINHNKRDSIVAEKRV